MQGPFLRKYGEATTINFTLFEVDGVDFRVDAVHASGDSVIMKDEGSETNTASGFVDEGLGYSIAISAAELQAARAVIYIIDQSATKVWLDTAVVVETYGNVTGAMHSEPLASGEVLTQVIAGSITEAQVLTQVQAGSLTSGEVYDQVVAGSITEAQVLTQVQAGSLTSGEVYDQVVAGSITEAQVLTQVQAGSLTSGEVLAQVIAGSITEAQVLTQVQAGSITSGEVLTQVIAGTPTAAEINAEIVDALNVDVYTEPGQGNLPVSTTLAEKINYIYKFLRNKVFSSTTEVRLYGDDQTTIDHKATIADVSGEFTRTEFITGA